MSPIKSDFIRKVLETYFSQIANLGISFFSIIFFSRVLGPTSRGMLATAMAIMALGVQFGNIGLHASNTYFVAKDRSNLPVIIGNTCLVSLLLGTLISIFIWGFYLVNQSLVPVNGFVLFLTTLLIPFGLAHLLFQNILLGIQEVRAYNLIEVSVRLLIFSLVCLLFLFDVRNVETILIINLMALIFGLFFTWMKLRPSLYKSPTFCAQFLKMSLAYGLKSYIAAFFAFIVLRIDLLMVKHILGFEQAGYYSIAANVADIFSICPVIVGTLLFPKMVSMTHEKNRFHLVKMAAFGVFLAMCLLAVFSALFAKTVVITLLGETFLPVVPAFLWLLPGLVLLAVNVVFMNYFASIGIPWIMIFSPGVAALANILLNYKMIPQMGIVGASISSTICYSSMLMMSLMYLYFRKRPIESTSPQEV